MVFNNLMYWYQKKIGTYDKQQWEKTLEHRFHHNFTYIPVTSTKFKTNLIDVDLVRGSLFPKAKPQHGLGTVAWLAVQRLLLLPIHRTWWVQQTSPRIFVLFLLLYCLQVFNMVVYYYNSLKENNETEVVSTLEVLIPAGMMLALCIIHSQIVSTNSGRTLETRQHIKKPGRSKRRRCHLNKKKTRQQLRTSELNASPHMTLETKITSKRDMPSTVKFSKTVISKLSGTTEPIQQTQNETWSTGGQVQSHDNVIRTDFHTTLTIPTSFQDVAIRVDTAQENNGTSQSRNEPIHQDDDGFESLNGNVSSENGEIVVDPPNVDFAEAATNHQSKLPVPKIERRKGNFSESEGEQNNNSAAEVSRTFGDGQPQCESEEEGECEDVNTHRFTGATTSATEWMGATTNSEDECSYSSELEESELDVDMNLNPGEPLENPFSWEFEIYPKYRLTPSCTSSDRVSCTIWNHGELGKAELSVLDIASAITARVESMPESMDYFYCGLVFSVILSFIPSMWRISDHITKDPSSNIIGLLLPGDLSQVTLDAYPDTLCRIIDIAFGSSLWERTVILISFFERLTLSGLLFFLIAIAERTYKQRLLCAKLFSHLTSSRQARKSELPHFRLNKVRNIKTWLSVRSYLKKRGPQRSVNMIVSAILLLALMLLSFVSMEYIKDSESLHSQYTAEALCWSCALGIYILRFMMLGTKIDRKYRNVSVLLTEQINLYLQIEQKPQNKDELMVANSVLKLAADLLKELESSFKVSGLHANPYMYTITKVVILSALSGVLSELLGFKLKLHKIKIK